MNPQTVTMQLGGKTLTLETGKMAKQADASVLVSYGDTRVLVTVVSAKEKKDVNFLPLTVEFQERYYASGKIPGSFHKREARPSTEATLGARQIDRPMRPLFPEGYYYDTQIAATVLSVDLEADAEVAANIGAGAAVHISDIPFNGPTAAVRVGQMNGEYIINPSWEQIHNPENKLEIIVAGTSKAIMMVEGGAREVPEDQVLGAILKGHEEIKKICALIEDFRKMVGKPKREFTPLTADATLQSEISRLCKDILNKALRTKEKQARYALLDQAQAAALETLVPQTLKDTDPNEAKAKEKEVLRLVELLQYNLMREMILTEKVRIDGRDSKTIRPITVETGLLPKAHGSALFTRGETQVLAVATLGTADDEQIIDSIYQRAMKKFMLHYNFPPYSTGETGRFGGQSRREIGHGALAERAIQQTLPAFEKFPYTIRLVCETLESNGSSSMASVCSSSMALMDAGVPYPKPVAGIAMGLIKENARVAILSDILGDEDFLGDMDFKVAGTAEGVTGIQMDIKIEGVDGEIMKTALAQAHEGRVHILKEMAKGISTARVDLNKNAPRITTIKVPVDRIGEVIGPSGKVIKDIVAKTGAKVNIEDDGTCSVASNDSEAAKKAVKMIMDIIAEAEVGQVYTGPVRRITEFGAFIGILPNQDGLLHVSEIAHERVKNVTDYFKEGDMVEVKVIDIDGQGRVRLSRKALLPPPAAGAQPTHGAHGSGSHGGGQHQPRPQQNAAPKPTPGVVVGSGGKPITRPTVKPAPVKEDSEG